MPESTVYSIIKRLEKQGLISMCKDEAAYGRRYYELTENGKHRLSVFKNEWEQIVKMHDYIVEEK